MSSKRGQIGETITWIVATLIILVILMISTYVSSLLAEKEKILRDDSGLNAGGNILLKESLFAYLLTENSEKETVHEQIQKNLDLNQFSVELGRSVFQKLDENDFKISLMINSAENSRIFPGKVAEKIKINKNLNIEMIKEDETSF